MERSAQQVDRRVSNLALYFARRCFLVGGVLSARTDPELPMEERLATDPWWAPEIPAEGLQNLLLRPAISPVVRRG
jgi:hypothetical protein